MKYCLDCNNPKSRKGNYCKPCGYKYRVQSKRGKGIYKLIKENPTSFKKGIIPWNKGMRSLELKGKSYDALHDWVERIYGKPKKCWQCGTQKASSFEWANVSGEYKNDTTDWMRLCKKCHGKYDYLRFGARKEFYT